jgi:hypothetical protein
MAHQRGLCVPVVKGACVLVGLVWVCVYVCVCVCVCVFACVSKFETITRKSGLIYFSLHIL